MLKRILLLILAGLLSPAIISCGEGNKPFMDKIPEQKNAIMPQKEYTEKNPGNWKGLEDEHLPKIQIFTGRKQNIVITVPVKNASQKHYIEKIAIIDKSGKELAAKVFSRHKKYFEAIFSIHPLPKRGTAKIYIKCNLHDVWTAPLR